MLRFIFRLMIYTIAIGFSIYIGVQWKLQDDIKAIVARSFGPDVEFDYQKSYLTLSGRVVIVGASFFFKQKDVNITADTISYSMGSVIDTAMQNQYLGSGELPTKFNLKFNEVMLHLNPSLVKMFSQSEPRSVWQTLSSSACGDLDKIGINQYFSMGYDYIVMSGEMDLFQDPYNNQLQIEGWSEIEETLKVTYQLNLSDYQQQELLLKPDLSNIRTLNLGLKDKGFNRRKNRYCAAQTDISNRDFMQQHIASLTRKLAQADLKLTNQALSAYSLFIQPESEVNILLEPEESFSNKDFFYFSESELRRLSGFKMEVNHQTVDKIFENWSIEKYKNIKTQKGRKTLEGNPNINKRFETLLIKRSFHQEKLSNLENYMDYRVKLIRDDHKIYQGRLKRVIGKRVYIVRPIQGGEVEVSMQIDRVIDFFVYR
ncbi:MAG: hypothetical protein Q9M92_01705 [Enterobacterales bacterium]|nr:hypothetical protein [Enterobacterales bacterium]